MKFIVLQVLLALAIANAEIPWFKSQFEHENFNFEVMPNHKNFTLMARYIVHNSNWTSVAYKSFEKDTKDLPLATIFSTADGPMSNGTGTPYFFLTEQEPAVVGLVRNDSRCGLMMSLVTTDICKQKNWDPEDPRCARVFLSGKIQILSNTTAEHEFAKKSWSGRHPYFVGMPSFHKFFYVKYVISSVKLISGTGGVRVVPLKDYFSVKDSRYNLDQGF